MALIKSLNQLITMHIKLIFPETFDIGDDFSDSRTNPFEEGEDDKNHGVPNIPTGPITWSKAKKIQQTFIVHLQDWIGSVQSSFLELEAETIDEEQLNICTVEVEKL